MHRLILKSMFQSLPLCGKAIIGLLNCEVSFTTKGSKCEQNQSKGVLPAVDFKDGNLL